MWVNELTWISYLTPVVQQVNNAINRINHYPSDSVIGFATTYLLDSNLSGEYRYPSFEQLGPGAREVVYEAHWVERPTGHCYGGRRKSSEVVA